MRRVALTSLALTSLALTALIVSLLACAVASATVKPRASLTDIENDVMCVVCNTPLAVSQAPEADRERAFINNLIAKGYTKPQIEQALVAEYGSSVLALPPAHGFNLTVYVLPPAIVLVGIAALVYVLPRWRRKARAEAASRAAVTEPSLDPVQAARLEEDLARHGT